MSKEALPTAEQMIIDTPVPAEQAGHKLEAISQLRGLQDFRAREDARRAEEAAQAPQR